MFRLHPHYRLKVPHSFAILGALLILASTLTGVGGTQRVPFGESAADVSSMVSVDESDGARSSPDAVEPVNRSSMNKSRHFRVNLFLFRH